MVANILTIAGSDSGGGAGIQADLKSFSAQGTYGASVITAITAQNTCAVTAVHPVPTGVIRAQIETVLSDIQIDAIKIGMLGMPDVIATLAKALADYQGPIVLDPVMIAKSGAQLLPQSAVAALQEHLVPCATVLTPNLPEAAVLLEAEPARRVVDAEAQGRSLQNISGGAVLMKGGHLDDDVCTDLLFDGGDIHHFSAPRVQTKNTHGTGCSYSAAIAALLGKGSDLSSAVREAHHWLHGAIARADMLSVGQGHGPVHHFHQIWA